MDKIGLWSNFYFKVHILNGKSNCLLNLTIEWRTFTFLSLLVFSFASNKYALYCFHYFKYQIYSHFFESTCKTCVYLKYTSDRAILKSFKHVFVCNSKIKLCKNFTTCKITSYGYLRYTVFVNKGVESDVGPFLQFLMIGSGKGHRYNAVPLPVVQILDFPKKSYNIHKLHNTPREV